jgi:SAM-dependent MidA family methyltransferase
VGSDGWSTMRVAWHAALYGPGGFYRTEQPADHFRTSAHVSGAFADAVLALARERDAATVVDLGAGAGELLSAIRDRDAEIALIGVEVRPRPVALAPSIGWRETDGDPADVVTAASVEPIVVVANELLDNVPGDVVELTPDGLRQVEVDASGRERLGAPAEPAVVEWIERWWPLGEPGQRAVAGLARDVFWSRVCESVDHGVCIAIDYGHVLADRPADESPTSYRRGRQSTANFDQRHDVTAPVAVDAVASAVGGRLARQRQALAALATSAGRPDVELAHSDPIGYLRRLGAAGDWRELTASPGLGDFWWLVTPRGERAAAASMAVEGEVAR